MPNTKTRLFMHLSLYFYSYNENLSKQLVKYKGAFDYLGASIREYIPRIFLDFQELVWFEKVS